MLAMQHWQDQDDVISIILWNMQNKGSFQPCLHHQKLKFDMLQLVIVM